LKLERLELAFGRDNLELDEPEQAPDEDRQLIKGERAGERLSSPEKRAGGQKDGNEGADSIATG